MKLAFGCQASPINLITVDSNLVKTALLIVNSICINRFLYTVHKNAVSIFAPQLRLTVAMGDYRWHSSRFPSLHHTVIFFL